MIILLDSLAISPTRCFSSLNVDVLRSRFELFVDLGSSKSECFLQFVLQSVNVHFFGLRKVT